jgi:hypothetical protein
MPTAVGAMQPPSVTGLAYDPMRGFTLSDNKSLDYFVTARRRA